MLLNPLHSAAYFQRPPQKKSVTIDVRELCNELPLSLPLSPSISPSLSLLHVRLHGRWMPCRQHTNRLTFPSKGVSWLAEASHVSQLKWEKKDLREAVRYVAQKVAQWTLPGNWRAFFPMGNDFIFGELLRQFSCGLNRLFLSVWCDKKCCRLFVQHR